MSTKGDRRRANRLERDPTADPQKLINHKREAKTQLTGQHSLEEKYTFIGRCGFDVLAAASMAEQAENGDEAVAPTGIDLPSDYLSNPDAATEAYRTLYKPSRDDKVLLGCIRCCNTVGFGVEMVAEEAVAVTIGQERCQVYSKTEPIQF